MVWTDDPNGPAEDIIPQTSLVDLGNASSPFKSATITTLNVENYNLLDGSDKNYSLSVYGAGTAYALTATSAAIDFGTTDPTLVLNKAGTYLLLSSVNLQFAGATFAASRTVTLKLRRTNNSAADVSNSSVVLATGITTTLTSTLGVISLPPVIYTTTGADVITDSISIFGDVSVIPSAGALNVTQASIVAVRLY